MVNVASFWGMTTPTYLALNALKEKYQGRPFEILGVPCNQVCKYFFADFVINYWVQCFVSQVWDGGAGRWFWDRELLGLCPAWNHRREAVPTAVSSGRENRGQRGRWGQCLHIPKSKFSTIVIIKPPKNHDFPPPPEPLPSSLGVLHGQKSALLLPTGFNRYQV